MSKVLRACAVTVAAALAVPLWGVPAAVAATATETASASGYFSSTGVPDTGTDLGKPPNVTAETDGVTPGNLPVAASNGREQKVSFLRFDLLEFEPGGTITKAELTVPLAPEEDGDFELSADPAKVRACLSGPEGFGGEHGESLSVAPARLCDEAQAPAKLSADGKSYVFDISPIAARWAEMNDGLALTAAEGAASTPFQVVFAPHTEATLTYESQPPADLAPVVDTPTDFGPVDQGGSADLGAGFGGGSLDLGDSGGFGSVDAPVVTADEPLPAAPAPAAEPEIAAAPVSQSAGVSEALRPTAAFWLGALLLGAGLVLLSLIMGDPRLPQATTRPSRLSQALQQRERGTSRAGRVGRPIAI